MGTGGSGGAEPFVDKAFRDLGSTMAVLHSALGDRYGLFKSLAVKGPMTPKGIADATNTNARYVEEWAKALTCAGYLAHDASTGRFSLPPENAAVLAEEKGEAFLGGIYQVVAAMVRVYDGVEKAFEKGGGVPAEAFHNDLWVGEERSNNMWHENLLVKDWIPRVPAVRRILENGGSVADVGSGGGRAVINLAKGFPKSRFVGYDIFPANVVRSRKGAKAEGVSDRVRFEQQDITRGIPGKYDLVTALDVVHDVQDPPKLLADVRKALRPGGRFLVMEINVADALADNVGPMGAFLYGLSPFYCMTISLARGGLGYGTAGLPPGRMKALAKQAGFKSCKRVDVNNPIQVLYDLAA